MISCSQLGKVGHAAGYPALIVSGDDALGWKRYGGFERNRALNLSLVNDRVWLGSGNGSDRAADGGFASLLKNSCRSASDPLAVTPAVRSRWECCLRIALRLHDRHAKAEPLNPHISLNLEASCIVKSTDFDSDHCRIAVRL